jgi:hypothetical protein
MKSLPEKESAFLLEMQTKLVLAAVCLRTVGFFSARDGHSRLKLKMDALVPLPQNVDSRWALPPKHAVLITDFFASQVQITGEPPKCP